MEGMSEDVPQGMAVGRLVGTAVGGGLRVG